MTDTPQLSGKDLALDALRAARAAAKTRPAPEPARTRPTRALRRGIGRDPVSIATALTGLGADIPLQDGLAGGNLLDQWPQLCPQYAGLVQPIHYDDTHGRLDLRPSSPAYAAQLRILGGQLAKQINDKLGRTVVRTIRVLPVGAVQQPDAYTAVYADPTNTPARDTPVKTHETASAGYRATLQAALTHRPDRQPTDPYVVEALARQEAALRASRQPEDEHRDGIWETDRHTSQPDPAEATRRAALARARQQKTGGDVPR